MRRERFALCALLAVISGSACNQPDSITTSPRSSAPVRTPVEEGGVSLIPARSGVGRFCQVAADQLHFPIACPTLVPAHALFRGTELCTGKDGRLGGPGCFRGGAFLIQEVFEGPPDYIGMSDSDGLPSNIGHLNVWASPSDNIPQAGLSCSNGESRSSTTQVLGQSVSWILCPEEARPPQDGGVTS